MCLDRQLRAREGARGKKGSRGIEGESREAFWDG